MKGNKHGGSYAETELETGRIHHIKIIFSGGSANNIHLLVDAPREINVARNSAGKDKKPSPYYKEKGISKTAQREIAEILMREKRNQSHVSGEETVTYKKRQ